MNYRMLGRTGLRVSEIGFGGWGLGGEAYGPTEDHISERALFTALDAGVNFIDTSDLYGAGRSEELIGRVCAGRRDSVILATKGGTLPHRGFHMPQDFSGVHLRNALQQSLRRLGMNEVDLYQLHSPTLDAVRDSDALSALEAFKQEGLVRCVGVSARSPADALWFVQNTAVSVVQVNFNLIDQRAEECGLFEAASRRGVGIVARTPLCFGYLTGTLTGSESLSRGDHRANWPVEQLRRWAGAPGLFNGLIEKSRLTPAQFALRFCLAFGAVSTVIPGMLSPEQVRENTAAASAPALRPKVRQAARQIYLNHRFYDPGIKRAAIAVEQNTSPSLVPA